MTSPVSDINLDAYLARIGYDGPRTATLATLRALHQRHPDAIVFEAIDVMLGRGVDLSPAAIDRKLIDAGRGGYCFEHNNLLRRALTALGFEVEPLAARVRWNQPPGAPPTAHNHMALRVIIDGRPWLADTGFGGLVLAAPLRLDFHEPQETGHETFRLAPAGSGLLLEVHLEGQWMPVYRLSPETCVDADYEQANWYTSTHPDSKFRRQLMVSRVTPQARYNLLNNRLTIRRPDGDVERRILDADGIEQVLGDVFGLPVEPAWGPVIEYAAAQSG